MTPTARWGCAGVVAYVLAEISIFWFIASLVGWWWVFVIVIISLVLGLGLIRYALGATGRSLGIAMASLRAPVASASVALPAGESEPTRRTSQSPPPAQTLLIVPAGILLAVPGLLTSAAGLVLWTPAVRKRLAARIERAARRAVPPVPPMTWPPPEGGMS